MKTLLLSILLLVFIDLSVNAGNSWSSKAPFGGTSRRNGIGLSIGDKGYVGLGSDSTGYRNDFWEFNPLTNSWTQKANFPGGARENASGFSIGDTCYIGTGYDGSTKNDFWAWYKTSNTWQQKTNFPGGTRSQAIAFSIGNKGYMGTGFLCYICDAYHDFYEYDPSTDSWTQKANFPGGGGNGTYSAIGFSIGTKGYLGTGANTGTEFWEYDQTLDSWTRKSDFAGCGRIQAVGFSIGTKGYIGTGWTGSGCGFQTNDFWEWDQSSDTWTQRTNYLNVAKGAVGFSICYKGYIGTGEDYYGVHYLRNFAEYTPTTLPTANFTASQSSFCTGTCIYFNDNSTNLPTSWAWTFHGGSPGTSILQNPINICFNTSGTDTISLTTLIGNYCPLAVSKTITVNPLPTATPVNSSVCKNSSVNINGNPSGGSGSYSSHSWTVTNSGGTGATYSNLTNTYQQTVTFNTSGLSSGTVTLQYNVTDNKGCSNSAPVSVTINQLPVINISGNDSICNGSNTTLTGSGGVSYNWTPSTGLSCISCSNPVASPIVNTTYTVTGTDVNQCSSSSTKTIIVNQPPALILSPVNPLCDSSDLNLSAHFVSDASYSWSGPNGFSSIFQSPSIINATIVDSGWYYCTITGSNGCSRMDSLLADITNYPHVLIAANGSTTFCQGDSVKLSINSSPPASSYLWNTGGTTSSIEADTSRNFYCTVNACGSNITTSAIHVTVNPNPVVAILKNGLTLNTNVTNGSSPYSYLWSTSVTDSSITISENGNYSVVVTDANGCSGTSSCNVNYVEIRENNTNDVISIYPNPVADQLLIQIPSSKTNQEAKMSIINILGEVLIQEKIYVKEKNVININKIPSGIYFIELSYQEKKYIAKIAKQ